jgi:hypothetical protein
MTAMVDTVPGAPFTKRWANVIRIHVANPWPTLVTPWLIFTAIFGLSYAIWRIVLMAAGPAGVEAGGFQYNGGVTWILFYMVVVAVQSMNQTFRFAIGFSSTRRDYYLGTAMLFVGLSALYAVGITLLAGVESRTGGWGVEGGFFAPAFMADLPLVQVAYVYFATLLFMFFLGSAVGSVFVRWGANGILVFIISVAVMLVATVWLVTREDAWGSVGAFFTDNSVPVIVTWSVPVTAVLALVGYALMRRATPRA